MPHGDYKKEFDESVKHLEELREKVLKASSPAEVSQIERDVRNALLAVIHYSNFLSFWMQEAANKRRKELREAPLIEPTPEPTPEPLAATPAPVAPKKTKKAKKTKAKKEKK